MIFSLNALLMRCFLIIATLYSLPSLNANGFESLRPQPEKLEQHEQPSTIFGKLNAFGSWLFNNPSAKVSVTNSDKEKAYQAVQADQKMPADPETQVHSGSDGSITGHFLSRKKVEFRGTLGLRFANFKPITPVDKQNDKPQPTVESMLVELEHGNANKYETLKGMLSKVHYSVIPNDRKSIIDFLIEHKKDDLIRLVLTNTEESINSALNLALAENVQDFQHIIQNLMKDRRITKENYNSALNGLYDKGHFEDEYSKMFTLKKLLLDDRADYDFILKDSIGKGDYTVADRLISSERLATIDSSIFEQVIGDSARLNPGQIRTLILLISSKQLKFSGDKRRLAFKAVEKNTELSIAMLKLLIKGKEVEAFLMASEKSDLDMLRIWPVHQEVLQTAILNLLAKERLASANPKVLKYLLSMLHPSISVKLANTGEFKTAIQQATSDIRNILEQFRTSALFVPHWDPKYTEKLKADFSEKKSMTGDSSSIKSAESASKPKPSIYQRILDSLKELGKRLQEYLFTKKN